MAFQRKDIKKCACCLQGIANKGQFLFWRLKVERLGLDHGAIQREHGMEQFMGGNVALASVFSDGRDLAKTVDGPHEFLVCENCVTRYMPGVFMACENTEAKKTGES